MFSINRSYSETKPQVVQYLGNNKYYYNYDIQEEEKDGEGGIKTVYSYVPIKLVNKPDYKRCVRSVIRKYIDVDEEFDLINTYMAQLMSGSITLDASNNEYQEYLTLVSGIKEKVSSELGVNK